MSESLNDDLPEVLRSVRTRPLFVMRLEVRKLQIVGATPGGIRRIGVVPGGAFAGERLSGAVLEGGSDWQTVRGDGARCRVVESAVRPPGTGRCAAPAPEGCRCACPSPSGPRR